MTAGRGPRHAGRKGGAPVRKSITTRYFYSTAVLLICSIAVMGFIQMYLAMGYFREENGTALIQTIDNAILAMQEAADDGIVEKRAEAAEAAGLDVEDIKRGITLTARAAGKGRGPQFLYTKQKALLGGSAFCIEGWESINKFGVIKFSSFSILLLLYLSKEESEKMLNKKIYKRKNSLYN